MKGKTSVSSPCIAPSVAPPLPIDSFQSSFGFIYPISQLYFPCTQVFCSLQGSPSMVFAVVPLAFAHVIPSSQNASSLHYLLSLPPSFASRLWGHLFYEASFLSRIKSNLLLLGENSVESRCSIVLAPCSRGESFRDHTRALNTLHAWAAVIPT